jgi:DNA-binding response OmpR family regulator
MAGARTILVIDDEPMVLRVVEESLRQEGYQVISATSVEQAIETANSLAGRIALVIVNLFRERRAGILSRRLRDCNPA